MVDLSPSLKQKYPTQIYSYGNDQEPEGKTPPERLILEYPNHTQIGYALYWLGMQKIIHFIYKWNSN